MSPANLGSHFSAAASLLVPDVVDAGGLAAILDVAQHLPSRLTPNTVLEIRLAEAPCRADFAFRIDETDERHAVLAGRVAGARIGERLLGSPGWQSITTFAGRWAAGTPALRHLAMWLEFDTSGAAERASVPSVFFLPDPASRSSTAGTAPASSRGWTLPRLEGVLAKWPGSVTWSDALTRCFRALPREACVEIVGLMLPRATTDLRLTISSLTPTAIRQYLDAIGWDHAADGFPAFVDRLPSFASALRLNLDVGASVGPRITVECRWYCSPTEFRASTQWPAFIDGLIADGLVKPHWRGPLLDTPPHVGRAPDGSVAWPSDLLDLQVLLAGSYRSTFWRPPMYIKLGYQPNRPVECKGYFWLTHVWAARSGMMDRSEPT